MLLSSTSCFIVGFITLISLDNFLLDKAIPDGKLNTFVPVVEFTSTSISNFRFLAKGDVQLNEQKIKKIDR